MNFHWQKLRRQPARLWKRIRHQGLGNTIGWFFYQLSWRRRERQLGIDTWEHAYGLNVDGTHGGQYYDPIDYRCLDMILDRMDPDPGRDVFLDYGCGLGRALIAAASRPFKRVVGIDVNDQLIALCRRHVEAARSRGALHCDVEILHQDAATYEVPHDVNRIFMFNAFVDELLQTVIQQVHKSLAENPRELTLVYVSLIRHENALESVPWLRKRCELPTAYWDHVRILVYDAQPVTQSPT